MKNKITIHCCTRDRHSELALLLQSLRTQSYQNWDIIILDESQTPITQAYFLNYLINRIKLEGHKVRLIKNNTPNGVCFARQKLIDEDTFGNELTLRLDDDCILQPDYICKLLQVIEKGYDLSSGVIPLLTQPQLERETRFVKPIINRIDVDNDGNITKYNDDCGYDYLEDEIIPASNFRTNLLYKSEINKKIKYELNLSAVSFREEAFFSLKAILKGYKLAVKTGAKVFHLSTPSGGTRSNPQLYGENVKLDDDTFHKWLKEQFKKHGNFLQKYYEKMQNLS